MKKTHLAKNIVQCEGWLAFGKTEHQTKHKLAALHLSVKCWRKMSGQLVHIELTACINIKFHSHCQIERCSDIFVCGNEKNTSGQKYTAM
jgi:hypothetical protein